VAESLNEYVTHCPLSGVYFIHAMSNKLDPLPSSDGRCAELETDST
jgi:hypothetical protein